MKGVCEGYYSLHMMSDARTTFFEPLLQNPPAGSKSTVTRLLKMMQNGRTTWRSIQGILQKLGALPGGPGKSNAGQKQPVEIIHPEPPKQQVWVSIDS